MQIAQLLACGHRIGPCLRFRPTTYSDSLISDAKSFSDEAVVVLTRVGGEGADLPMNMKAEGITYENNSKDYEDFKDGESSCS